jgi:hypothetical protein
MIPIEFEFQPFLNIKHEPEEIIIDVLEAEEQEADSYLIDQEELDSKDTKPPFTRIIPRKKYRRKGPNDEFGCGHCNNRYLTKQGLNSHLKIKHGVVNERKKKTEKKVIINHFCKLCNKVVKNLEFHLVNFHSDKNYECDLCDFSSKYSKNLMVHKESVSGFLIFMILQQFQRIFP